MFERSPIIDILLENCESYSERREVLGLTEADLHNVNNNMVGKLFNSALSKAHIDYEDIPKSKGDITKYSGYKSMIECLELLKDISSKSGHKIPEIEIVSKAINNIVANRDLFERGIKLNKDYVVLQYNTLVMSCVISVSCLITSYVDYMKRIDSVEFVITNPKSHPGSICVENLEKFNRSVSSGDFAKVMNSVVKSNSQELTGTAMAITGVIITGAVLGVTFMRDIVFYVYYSRVKLADYLRTQALFLELNKNIINAKGYNMPANKKDKVLKNQAELTEKLKKMADSIDVNDRLAVNNMNADIKKENSSWKLDDIKSEDSGKDSSGFQLI